VVSTILRRGREQAPKNHVETDTKTLIPGIERGRKKMKNVAITVIETGMGTLLHGRKPLLWEVKAAPIEQPASQTLFKKEKASVPLEGKMCGEGTKILPSRQKGKQTLWENSDHLDKKTKRSTGLF